MGNSIGAVANMVHPLSAEKELEFYINESKSITVVTLDQFYGKFEAIRQNTNLVNVVLASIKDELGLLVKAVYLLFLRHSEGIAFKQLPDYREELTIIYNKLKPSGLTDRAIQSIEDVTNPMLNSINEKCARIRAAFLGEFDDYMARSYYINGLRGDTKKITLPRNLVIWE